MLLQVNRQARQARLEAARESEGSRAAAPVEDASPEVPAFVATRYEEGIQLYRASDLVGAMQAWEEVARVAPGYQEVSKFLLRVYRVTGLESYTEGRLREAVDIWEKGRRLEPDNEQLRRYLEQAYAKLARTQSEATGH
jgi:tetratricopeptide (TPR) repeat protein